MATQNAIFDAPYVASSNVSALVFTGNPPTYSSGGIGQFCAVTYDTATGNPRDVKLAGTNTTFVVGINQSSTALPGPSGIGGIGPGDSAEVRVIGISKAQASAAITVGAAVAVANASGQLGPAPALGATSVFVVGYAQTAASAAGDIFEVLLTPGATAIVNA